MSRRIVVIDDGGPAIEPVLACCDFNSAQVVRCHPTDGTPRATTTDLLLPVALTPSPHWISFFGELPKQRIPSPVLAVLGADSGGDLIAVAARAADDFILWGSHRVEEFQQRVTRLLVPVTSAEAVSETLTQSVALAKLIGEHPAFVATIAQIPKVARSSGVVLILGETGTGKELCARAVHHLSPRRHLPFIPVDCAALPDSLVENELFGHVRGAFTDAHRDQPGLVAMAEGGTLFLDEIDSLSLPIQAKLLRLIEERVYKPLGADRFSQANVRIVAACSRPLDELVHLRQFRVDLFFRLNVLRLHLPPLRARRSDIAILARHFVHQIAIESASPRKALSPAAIDKLVQGAWPGNVRELLNVLQRAFVFCEGRVILPAHIVAEDDGSAVPEAAGGFGEAKKRSIAAFERVYVQDLLRKHNGNITHAAKEAKKDRRAFSRLVTKHGIDRRTMQSR